jgi:ribosomal-protein-alanine N-acetyltransferase
VMALRALRPGGVDGEPVSGLTVQIIPMKRRHLRQVMQIETRSYPEPWSVGLFISELALPTRDYFVARVGTRVVGYAGMMTHGDESHITNVAVDLEWRRHHVATRLLVQLVRAALERGSNGLTLEVRVGNHVAQGLYYRFGFAPEGVRKNYYPQSNEDALIMWARDISSPSYRSRIEEIAKGISGTTLWAR